MSPVGKEHLLNLVHVDRKTHAPLPCCVSLSVTVAIGNHPHTALRPPGARLGYCDSRIHFLSSWRMVN